MSDLIAIFSRLADWQSIFDLTLVTLCFFTLLWLFRGTLAEQLLRGIFIIGLLLFVITRFAELTAFSWLLRSSSVMVLVAIPVIFQPEIRRALERVGRGAPFFLRRTNSTMTQELINDIVRACEQLAEREHGALLILEGRDSLEEYINRGIGIEGEVSVELLMTIMFPGTPLHDGAAIIQDDKIMAASCILPLTSQNISDSQLGTRHRAAIGITEISDAMSIVVSEETGAISIATGERLVRGLDSNDLRHKLTEFYDTRQATYGITESPDESE